MKIDDLAVPKDKGYGYDDYGCNHTLTLEDLLRSVHGRVDKVFFPAAPSVSDTGFRRGSVVCAPIPAT